MTKKHVLEKLNPQGNQKSFSNYFLIFRKLLYSLTYLQVYWRNVNKCANFDSRCGQKSEKSEKFKSDVTWPKIDNFFRKSSFSPYNYLVQIWASLAQNKQKLLKIFYFWVLYGIYREFHQVVSEYGQKSMIYPRYTLQNWQKFVKRVQTKSH